MPNGLDNLAVQATTPQAFIGPPTQQEFELGLPAGTLSDPFTPDLTLDLFGPPVTAAEFAAEPTTNVESFIGRPAEPTFRPLPTARDPELAFDVTRLFETPDLLGVGFDAGFFDPETVSIIEGPTLDLTSPLSFEQSVNLISAGDPDAIALLGDPSEQARADQPQSLAEQQALATIEYIEALTAVERQKLTPEGDKNAGILGNIGQFFRDEPTIAFAGILTITQFLIQMRNERKAEQARAESIRIQKEENEIDREFQRELQAAQQAFLLERDELNRTAAGPNISRAAPNIFQDGSLT